MDIQKKTMIKHIRSFVRREGRFTTRQKNAFNADNTAALIDLSTGIIASSETPLVVEIGFGMGHTLIEMAKASPETNFIGIEVYKPGIGTVLAAIKEEEITNLRVLPEDAQEALPACIPDNSLQGINIFFPDPWPKQRHHKRRLIQPPFVELLLQKLKNGGYIHLATDWEDYAKHMLSVLSESKQLQNNDSDNDFSKTRQNRPMTKYEKRGLNLGHPVWDLIFTKRSPGE